MTEQGLVDLFRGGSVGQVREPRSDSPHGELLRSPYGTWRGIRQEGFPMLSLRRLYCLEVSLLRELGCYLGSRVVRGAGPIPWSEPSTLYRHLLTTLPLVTHHLPLDNPL